MADTALFVIDIQNELATDPATRVPHADRVRTAGAAIVEAARAHPESASSPSLIVFVQHEEAPTSGNLVRGTRPWELVFAPDASSAATATAATAADGREWLVAKTTRDAFASNADLADRLRARGIRRIAAFGLQSDFCVRSTSQGALAAGFAVTMLQGAHSTYDDGGRTAEEIERAVEGELAGLGAIIVPWEAWVAGLGP